MKVHDPRRSEEQVKMLFQVMDSDNDGSISELTDFSSPYCFIVTLLSFIVVVCLVR